MKKILFIGIIPVVLGIIAGALRAYELAFSFDFATGLPSGNLWATPIILAIAAVLLICVIALTAKRKFPIQEGKGLSQTVVAFFSCAMMLALGGYVFVINQVEGEAINLIFAVICLISAFAFALLGAKNLQNNQNSLYSFMALVPVIWACVALILVFRDRIADPIWADYIHIVFAYIGILMFAYAQTGYVYQKNTLWIVICSATVGTFFCIVELISPFIASALNPEYILKLDFTVILPLVTFAVYMPVSAMFMLKNQNDVK